MCTLILLRGVVRGFPLVLAMNRDEFLDRPSGGPRLWPGAPPLLAPVDLRSDGTWCGLSGSGLLVAVTNRGREGEREASKRSRGKLVLDLLRGGRTEARQTLEENGYAGRFNGFHALVADPEGAFLAESDTSGLRVEEVDRPLTVMTNGEPTPDIRRLMSDVDANGTRTWPEAEGTLAALLRRHDLPTCRHLEDRGTRSSILFALPGAGLSGGKLLYAEGPPCTTPYEDRSRLVEELGRTKWTV
jgi:hypothetical protein